MATGVRTEGGDYILTLGVGVSWLDGEVRISGDQFSALRRGMESAGLTFDDPMTMSQVLGLISSVAPAAPVESTTDPNVVVPQDDPDAVFTSVPAPSVPESQMDEFHILPAAFMAPKGALVATTTEASAYYDFPVAQQAALPAVAGGVVLLSALPAVVQAVVRGLGVTGILRYANFPAILRTILVGLGITQVFDIMVDAPGVPSLPFGGGGDYPPEWGSVAVARTWNAGGTPFAMRTDGLMAARRKNGVWTTWRPEKPVVITRNMSVKDMVRADKRLNTKAKAVRKVLDRRAPRRTAKKPEHIVVSGRGDDVNIIK